MPTPVSARLDRSRRLLPPRARLALGAVTARSIAAGSAVLALGLSLIWFLLPGNLFGVAPYDAGVYFGVALRLVDGVVPYRDFVFVHPPGIAFVMAPLALLSKVTGASAMFVVSRLLTAAVAAANAGLTALVVRHRGRLAMAVAGVGMALFPYAATVSHDLKLEPYLVLLCLLALLVAQRPGAPSTRRLLAIGLLVGFAGAIKIWAFFPFLALLGAELIRSRRRAGLLVTGTAIGFGLPCLPFFAAAPSRMFHDVVLDQLGRGGYDYTAISLPNRLGYLSGVNALFHDTTIGAVLGTALVAGLLVGTAAAAAGAIRGRGSCSFADGLLAATALLALAELLAAPGLYVTYSYFTAPFVLGLAALLVGEARRRHLTALAARGPVGRLGPVGPLHRSPVVRVVIAVAAGGLAAWLAVANLDAQGSVLGGGRLAANGSVLAEGPAIASAVPAGSCVVTDDLSLLISSNRYQAQGSGCPQLIDPFGMWMVADHGRGAVGKAPRPRLLVAYWHGALARAGALVLSNLDQLMIPWTPRLERQLRRNFQLVLTEPDASVYLRRVTDGPGQVLRRARP